MVQIGEHRPWPFKALLQTQTSPDGNDEDLKATILLEPESCSAFIYYLGQIQESTELPNQRNLLT